MKKISAFVALLVLLMIIYLVAHWGVYFAFVYFFAITSIFAKNVLLDILIFLAASFFLATWLTHKIDNVLTRAYYFFSGVWLGFGVNLLLFFGLAWIVVFLSSLFDLSLNQKNFGIVAICGAFFFSIYGIWNNFTPIVTRLDVKIDNLPEFWKGKKIVQISDVHLGHIFGASYMHKVAKQINALKPDAIVITGDLFDGTDGNLKRFIAPLNELEASQGIFFVDGNHETYLGAKEAFAIIAKTKIMPLRDQMLEVEGLQFVGLEYPERMLTKNVEQTIKNIPDFDPRKPSVLLWHIPTQIEGAKKAGISLQLSGHTHKGQLFPFGFITALVYRGYDCGFKNEGSYSIYTSSGLGLWGPPMRTEKKSEIVEITLR